MTELKTIPQDAVVPYSKLLAQIDTLSQRYRNADPFPHIVLDHFLNEEILNQALGEFPRHQSPEWIHYIHFNEKKLGLNKMESFPPTVKRIFEELNSARFIHFLNKLTEIDGLFADGSLEGGGLHQSADGGFLNIHADFTSHPHHRDWQRRVNALIYLNKNWEDSFKGHLELWDKKMKRCVHKVAPVFNRCVIFNTDADSFHGHPDPLACPKGVTRKSFALYYFTRCDKPFVRSTEYKGRPGDGLKKIFIYCDKMILRTYDAAKRRLGIQDHFASALLRSIDRWKRKRELDKQRKKKI